MPKFLPPVLESERHILRPLTIDDLQDVFKWTGDPHVNKYGNLEKLAGIL